ncbi:hypothetical protein GBAR_LOCUS22445 [Geodia barretti]|uniref:Calx-beta domain-containing protein n=1 Tax=Geodia barretti TaxID=519541 RepID=A0AA35T2Y6_GEOBA|nr:hypothetical protein GBAR_LOCUS22445 [Geodia barretti]
MIYVDLVVVKGAIDRNVTVSADGKSQDGDTAFEGEDYEVIERGLTIHPTTTRITSSDDPISIVNDIRITITDTDDCLPVVRMTVEPTVVSEAGEIVEVTVSLAGGGGNLPGEVQLGISTVPIQPKDIDSVGVEILTQSEVTLTFEEGSSSRQLQIGVRDNSNLNISSDYVEVRITDDEPQPEVIGFEETEYEVMERRESYQFTLAVVQGSLAQNLTLTVISTPITAAANDYRVLEPWVPLEENGTGTVRVEISTEPGQEDGPQETFRLTIIEESGVTPKNVFFRGALIYHEEMPP